MGQEADCLGGSGGAGEKGRLSWFLGGWGWWWCVCVGGWVGGWGGVGGRGLCIQHALHCLARTTEPPSLHDSHCVLTTTTSSAAEEGIEAIHLYSGRTVCRLHLPSPGEPPRSPALPTLPPAA